MSAIITGLASVLQNTVNAFSTRAANRRQLELMQQQQRYYSPAAYINRLKAAGLNPRLANQYNEPTVSTPNIQANQFDLSGIAKAIDQAREEKGQKKDFESKDIDIAKGNIDLGNKPAFDKGMGFESPYEKGVNLKNQLLQKEVQGRKVANYINSIKADYVDKSEQNRQSLDSQRIDTLTKINEIKKYDVKTAQEMLRYLTDFGVFDSDTPELKLLKIGSVKLLGKKLDDSSDATWDYLKTLIFPSASWWEK